MQTNFGSYQVTIQIMVYFLFSKHSMLVRLVSPEQIKCFGLLINILFPSPTHQHSLHPYILGIKNKDLLSLIEIHSPLILIHEF